MRLVIVHYHYRPGGVRRVIELATPAFVKRWRPRVDEVVLVGGEAPDGRWLANFQRLVTCPVRCSIERAFGYWSEQRRPDRARISRRIDAHLAGILDDTAATPAVVWAHNPGLGRNLLLARALDHTCAARGVPLVFHHHDWWFDNRWARWPEMRQGGFRTLGAVASAILPGGSHMRHAAISRSDAGILGRNFGRQAGWMPNPADPAPPPPAAEVARARSWLRREIGEHAPVWLLPCRLLRRKNIAEALLLTRWLRPEAWVVTTGDVSSADERAYATALAAAARVHGWKLKLAVLAGDESAKPSVAALVAGSEALLLTSLQEGFGLPYIEAAAAQRPLIARMLPNIAPDLAHFGFRFPHAYDDVRVASSLFDTNAEARRQRRRWHAWRRQIPAPWRRFAAEPPWLASTWRDAIPFSRLTLAAQVEVLARPAAESWALCAPCNPWLGRLREQAERRALQASPWPGHSARWLGEDAYARAVLRLIRARPTAGVDRDAGWRAMREFARTKLAADNQYPLLWSRDP